MLEMQRKYFYLCLIIYQKTILKLIFFGKVGTIEKKLRKEDIIFTISDTEYVLRKLVEAKIDGREVEQASDVMKKVKQLHKKLMEQGVAINS